MSKPVEITFDEDIWSSIANHMLQTDDKVLQIGAKAIIFQLIQQRKNKEVKEKAGL